MNRRIVCTVAVMMTMSLVCGCAGRGNKEEHKDVLTFEQAKAEESTLMTTDEIVNLIKSDTTHKKVVYWFDMLCKPCRVHLQNEIGKFYAEHDTAEWHIYLVAGMNGLHHAVPDKHGNLVEDAAEGIRHFVGEYREHMPEMGFDMKDVYLHYDPALETEAAYKEKYPDGFFNYVAGGMFHSDVAFRYEHDGVPKLFVADRDNTLLVDYYVIINKNSDTLDAYYMPNEDYYFEALNFGYHDTLVGVMMQ